jgi:hypothetical protein
MLQSKQKKTSVNVLVGLEIYYAMGLNVAVLATKSWYQGQDSNLRPLGYDWIKPTVQ